MPDRPVPPDRSGSRLGPRMSLTPVVRAGLTDRVINQLRQRIAEGVWPLHQRIPVEAALAKELDVGRSTIREAVRVLVHSGLLEVRQGAGTYVRSRREIDAALQRRVLSANLIEAFEVRRGLEVEIARLAAAHRSDADLVRLRELAGQRADSYTADAAVYRGADLALREHLLSMARNVLLADLYRGFVEPLAVAVSTYIDDAELTRDDPDRPETPELVAAIERQDATAAAAAAARHIDNAIRILRYLFQVVIIDR